MAAVTPITTDELKLISRYIYDICGIYLDESKAYLIETRLKRLMRETGAGSYYELYQKAKTNPSGALEGRIIDAICTRETMFFRDRSPFELLKTRILPDLLARKTASASSPPARIRIWSAGCSTGQEIYSVAMILKEFSLNPARVDIRLLGTDISDTAISCARAGEFSQVTVERGLPGEKLTACFVKGARTWRIRDDIRSMCTFKKHNLMHSFSELGRFDIVLCRNVAIYFQPKDKTALFDKFADALDPDGYLIIGSSESISRTTSRFAPVAYSNMIYYRLKNRGGGASAFRSFHA